MSLNLVPGVLLLWATKLRPHSTLKDSASLELKVMFVLSTGLLNGPTRLLVIFDEKNWWSTGPHIRQQIPQLIRKA